MPKYGPDPLAHCASGSYSNKAYIREPLILVCNGCGAQTGSRSFPLVVLDYVAILEFGHLHRCARRFRWGSHRGVLSSCALLRGLTLLNARECAGKVRRCHGDLHLRNICLVGGNPTLFDCLEFDEDIAAIDVLYDLAFLVMDLWHRGLESGANLVFNRYLDECDETDGLPLMPFFMAIRASIRAHVTATQAEQASNARRKELVFEAKAYLALAVRLIAPARARIVAIGGLSGTGKSTVAAVVASQIGPAPGARVLASDRIRKRLHGVRAEVGLSKQAYCPEVSERVYAALVQDARAVLSTGHAVVADAVFDRTANREQIKHAARDIKIPFTGIWLYARPETLFTRVDARRGDASDATVDVVRAQLASQNDPHDWIWVEADGAITATAARVVEAIEAT